MVTDLVRKREDSEAESKIAFLGASRGRSDGGSLPTVYKQDEEGLRRVCTRNTPSRIQVRGWRPFQITEELTEKDTASGETSSAGSGGRQTWRGPDAREGLHKEVMEGEPAASFPPQLQLGQSRTGNCRGRETTFLGGKGSRDATKLRRQDGGATPCRRGQRRLGRARVSRPEAPRPPRGAGRSQRASSGLWALAGAARGLTGDCLPTRQEPQTGGGFCHRLSPDGNVSPELAWDSVSNL